MIRVMKGLVVLALCLVLAGCGPAWKKKFVRKRAPRQPDQVLVYEAQDYQKEPNADLYKKHFIFWRAWQEELVVRMGNNPKADVRAFEEALKNLDDMKRCLKEAKAAELDIYIQQLRAFYDTYKSEELDVVRAHQMSQDLDRMMVKMDKQFRFSKVKDSIK
jgi:hypothetical protein